MTPQPFIADSDADIAACFPAFSALRPHIVQQDFLPQVRRQQAQGYQVLALRHDGIVKSAAGFRCAEFLAWGRVLYIDDLTTLPGHTGQGYASALLDWLVAYAKECQCDSVHLDSGYARHTAHRLYLQKGFQLSSHHFSLSLRAAG